MKAETAREAGAPGAARAARRAHEKVLLVASAAWAIDGGLERFNRRITRSLAELISASRLAGAAALIHYDQPQHAGRYPEGVPLTPGRASVVRTLLSFVWLTLTQGYDVILYGNVAFAPLLPLAAVIRPRARRILLVHGIEVWARPSGFRRWAVRKFADEVVSVSRFTVARMCKVYGLTEGRFRILANAVDTRDAPASPGVAAPDLPGVHRILTVARMSEMDRYKNVDKVILALPRIEQSFPGTHYFVIGQGPLRPDLEALAERTGVRDKVHFLGYVDDATRNAYYEASHVFVLPSTGEGFGIVYLEAWQFGLPVICSDRDAGQEVVRDGVDGRCVPPTPESVAGAVCAMLGDPGLRQRMGTAGRDRVTERYGHDRFRETLAEILLGRPPCAA